MLFKEKDQKLKNFKQGQGGQASTVTAEQKGQQLMVGNHLWEELNNKNPIKEEDRKHIQLQQKLDLENSEEYIQADTGNSFILPFFVNCA